MRNNTTVTLEEYIATAFQDMEEDEHIVLQVNKTGYPIPEPNYRRLGRTRKDVYVGVSTVYPAEEDPLVLNRRNQNFAGMYMLVIDDVGTKCRHEDLPDMMQTPSAIIETSPGNHQYHYFLDEPIRNLDDATWFIKAMYAAGPWDSGGANAVKLVRPPAGCNTKGEYDLPQVRCLEWSPEWVYSVEDLLEAAGVEDDWEPGEREHKGTERASIAVDGDDEVLQWLSDGGRLVSVNGAWAGLTECPWASGHTGGDVSGAAYMAGDERAFKCHHDACSGQGIDDFLAWVAEQGGPVVDAIEIPQIPDMPDVPGMPAPQEGPKDMYQFADQFPRVKKKDLPDAQLTADGHPKVTQLATTRNLSYVMDQMQFNIRFNLMTGDAELVPPEWVRPGWYAGLMPEAQNNAARAAYVDQCLVSGISKEEKCHQVMAERAIQAPYHPVEDWILSAEWDGVDRFEQLFETITLVNPDDEATARMYLDKWLRQVVECVRGYRGLVMKDLVLTFVGGQGCGKTTWIERLMPEGWVSTGVSLHLGGGATAERDSIRKATRGPIVELGELDATFKKSDVSQLKSYLSSVQDVYRMSYGRSEVTRPRCTAYAGSVNQQKFLVDTTGSRRFLVIPVTALNGFHDIDLQQLWAQMNVRWEANRAYHMNQEESAAQQAMNTRFMAPSEAREAVDYYFNMAGPEGLTAAVLTVVQVSKILGLPRSPVALGELSQVLEERFGPSRRQVQNVRNAWVLQIRHEDMGLDTIAYTGGRLKDRDRGYLSLVPGLPDGSKTP